MNIDDAAEASSFSSAFSAALSASSISLSSLRRRLIDRANPVSIATLSYWRSGERTPEGATSLAVVDEIERLLDLQTGALVGLIPERVRLGRLHEPRNPFTEEQIRTALAETLAILDAPPLDITRQLSSQVVADVAADGYLRRRTARTLIQSVVPQPVDHVTCTLLSEVDTMDRPEMTTNGARIIREHLHASGHVYAAVMQLDHPLTLGASTMIEVTMESRQEYAWRPETGAFVVRPIHNLVLWTRFHPDAVPDWVDEVEQADDTEGLVTRPLRPQSSVHQSRRDFGPGTLGIRWGYDDR